MSIPVLIVGSGGREHALAWKLSQSPQVSRIFVVPGNGGTASIDKVENVTTVKQDDFAGLLGFAIEKDVRLLVPGPEAPLVEGITDYFDENGPSRIRVFGPSKAAAQMEGSKAFSKDFMKRHNIPTASYETFTDHSRAKNYLDTIYADRQAGSIKVVIKASGLAAGKGVVLPESYQQAVNALSSIMLEKEFGTAGDSVVIEEYLEGEEISILSFSDGHTIKSLPAAQDHKRIRDGDQGGNTGGMGAYAPAAVARPQIMKQIHDVVLQPTIDGMADEKYPFIGCLFTGFMLTSRGPKVLEYNVRFGDPECQTLFPLLDTDLAELMLACTNGHLRSTPLKIKPGYSTTVVVAAGGYPGSYEKGTVMTVSATTEPDIMHFHAGTRIGRSCGRLKTNGGRVIASTALDSTIQASRDKAYQGVELIKFDGMHYRTDIGKRELDRRASAATNKPEAMSYAKSGVSIQGGNDLVSSIKDHLLRTATPACPATIGGFGGEIMLSKTPGFPSNAPTIVAAIDGIGTKIMVALATGVYDTIGIDLVAMNVNDLVVQGARPVAFLDYYACGRLDGAVAERFVKGVAEGCVQAGSALIGGETAEMPGVYHVTDLGNGKFKSDFDAAGCAIGVITHDQEILPDKAAMIPGDVLIGLASSGPHSNGFSLIRTIVEREGLDLAKDIAPWDPAGRTVGQALLEPTKIYVKSLLSALEKHEGAIKGMAHITGGGLTENIPRMLPKHLSAKMQVGSWEVPSVLRWLKNKGGLENEEFAKTFNTGLGMVLVVAKEKVSAISKELEECGEAVSTVGELVEDASEVMLQDVEKWNSL